MEKSSSHWGTVARWLGRHAALRTFRIFARPLDAKAGHRALAGLELCLMSEAQMAALCPQPELELRAERVSAAYARGDFCVAALSGATVAGYCWFAFSPLPHLDGVWVRFSEDVVWPYKSFVRPAFRGRGIAPALYHFGDGIARERGRSRSVICVETHNRASVQAAARSGYAPSGLAAYLRRPRLLAWSSPAAEKHGVAFFA